MKISWIAFLFVSWITATVSAQKIFISSQLHKKWETPALLKTPESVLFDKLNNVIYVSNINGSPSGKDGNGFISKLSADGKILELEWIKGLDAPKGMGIFNGLLFVTNLTEVAEIDIAKKTIINRIAIPESRFLNDIDIDNKGIIYISDSGSGKVYRIFDGKVEIWQGTEQFEGANGLYCQAESVFVGTKNAILQVNSGSGNISVFADNTGSIDGLESLGYGQFLFSDWTGSVYRVKKGGQKELLLDSSGLKINAADLDFIPNRNLILIPTFFDNRVMAYELK